MLNLRNQSGYTLVEILAVLSIMSLVGFAAMVLMAGSAQGFNDTAAETFTDTDAVLAMQAIVSDVREAKDITVLDAGPDIGKRLRVIPPLWLIDEKRYDRHIPDPTRQVEYYLSDSSGIVGRTGTWLWRAPANGVKEVLKRDIAEIEFKRPTETRRAVMVTVTASNHATRRWARTELTQRVVFMRNY